MVRTGPRREAWVKKGNCGEYISAVKAQRTYAATSPSVTESLPPPIMIDEVLIFFSDGLSKALDEKAGVPALSCGRPSGLAPWLAVSLSWPGASSRAQRGQGRRPAVLAVLARTAPCSTLPHWAFRSAGSG